MKTTRRRPALADRLRAYFGAAPRAAGALQIAPSGVTGAAVGGRERTAVRRVAVPLPAGAVLPSFDRPNVADPAVLADRVAEAVRRLELQAGPVSLLLPELSARLFVFACEKPPVSAAERERIARWRIGKQMPAPPDDLRLAVQALPAGGGVRLAAAAARETVVREYEAPFARLHRRVGLAVIPSLSLLRLAAAEPSDGSLVVVNAEEDALGLTALLDGALLLYRQKSLAGEAGGPDAGRVRTIVQEVLNTLHFLEDKEKRQVGTLWVRSAVGEEGGRLRAALADRTGLAVSGPAAPAAGWSDGEAELLAPLLGQLS